jgi:hypothetical protein
LEPVEPVVSDVPTMTLPSLLTAYAMLSGPPSVALVEIDDRHFLDLLIELDHRHFLRHRLRFRVPLRSDTSPGTLARRVQPSQIFTTLALGTLWRALQSMWSLPGMRMFWLT